ncbi:assembly factor cbp4 [Mortierella alpina]|uniref:Cytochrome b mRNA-processing protein 4 n=1 Tax=Mortierella alpina TaxID=64518 RepID=A0A9P6JCG2_MORAP|nr:assembly factor cbp4 [Mortierella alpina]
MGNYPKAFAIGFGIVGLGYTLMLTTVPTEEQLYEKLSPELKKQYEQVKADQARRQAFSDVLRQAAADPEPMWIKKKTPAAPAPPSAASTASKDQ